MGQNAHLSTSRIRACPGQTKRLPLCLCRERKLPRRSEKSFCFSSVTLWLKLSWQRVTNHRHEHLWFNACLLFVTASQVQETLQVTLREGQLKPSSYSLCLENSLLMHIWQPSNGWNQLVQQQSIYKTCFISL